MSTQRSQSRRAQGKRRVTSTPIRKILVGAGALNQTPFDWTNNLTNIREAIRYARGKGVRFLVLPELAITGYGCEDRFHSARLLKRAWSNLLELRKDTERMVVFVGLPVLLNKKVYNAVAVLANGKLCGFFAKLHLAGDGVHYEGRWFEAWPEGVQSTIGGPTDPFYGGAQGYPIGDLIFQIDGIRVGAEVCEDAWTSDRPARRHALRGVDILINPSASHFAFGKQATREGFVKEGSRAYRAVYIYTNLLGNEAGRVVFDGTRFIAVNGEIVARGERLTFNSWEVLTAVVNIDSVRQTTVATKSARTQIGNDESIVVVPGCPLRPAFGPEDTVAVAEGWETASGEVLRFEEFSRAIALGLFDYLRKSKSRGCAVSTSGGADSSATVALVWLMIQLGIGSLGLPGFLRKLSYIPTLKKDSTEREIIHALLKTAYQGTENSSDETRDAARALCEGIGSHHHDFNVGPIVGAYTELIEGGIGRKLEWASDGKANDDITLQNLQARVRAPSIWALANVYNLLLLVTSNRSEAAVGYCTMDGDTAGGLSLIGGIDKTFLRRWLRWMESEGPRRVGRLEDLQKSNALTPTAQLRPKEFSQTDEDDLMPYPILNAIEELAIRDLLDPDQVVVQLLARSRDCKALPAYRRYTQKFFQLWVRNQWKRERFAISIHVDDHNLDPKTWCRFPVLSGGFEVELAELERTTDRELRQLAGLRQA